MSLKRTTKKLIAGVLCAALLITGPGMYDINLMVPLSAEQPADEAAGMNDDGNPSINDDGNPAVPDEATGTEEYQGAPVYVPANNTFGNSAYGSQANNTLRNLKTKTTLKWRNLKQKVMQKTGIRIGTSAQTPLPPSHFGKVTLMDKIRNLTRGYVGGSQGVSVGTAAAGGMPVSYVGTQYTMNQGTLSPKGKGKGKAFALGIATGAAAVVAFPFLATGIGAAGGMVAGLGGGLVAMLAGAAGAVLGGASTVLGFITGLAFSPIFLPALLIGGAIALAWYLLKKRKRQNPNLGSGSDLPWTGPISVGGTSPNVDVIPGGGSSTPPSPDVDSTPVVTAGGPAAPSPDAAQLQAAYQRYIGSYNKYLGIINYTPGASTPDQAMQNNLSSEQAQSALKEYKSAYADYIKLRQGQ